MRAQCVALWTMQLLITSAALSFMGQLLPLALLQARGEHIGLNAIMHSYLTPDLPKYSCLSFFSSVSLEPLIPMEPIILLYAISVHGCHTFRAIQPTHVLSLSTFNNPLSASHTPPPSHPLPVPPMQCFWRNWEYWGYQPGVYQLWWLYLQHCHCRLYPFSGLGSPVQ